MNLQCILKGLALAAIASGSMCLVGCQMPQGGTGYTLRTAPDNYLFRRGEIVTVPAPAPAPAAAPASAPAAAPVAQPVSAGPCPAYRPNVPAGYNANGLAFPTGDIRSSAILLTQLVPAQVRANAPYTYEIHVTNLSSAPLQNVVVTSESLNNLGINSSEPSFNKGGNGSIQWALGNLEGCQTRIIKVNATAMKVGTATDCVTVSYNNVLCSNVQVVEPALQLVKTATPEIIICDCTTLKYEVRNPGTGNAENVVIRDTLPAGLTVDGKNTVEIPVGTLTPGQARAFEVCAKAAKPGRYESPASAVAAGNLTANAAPVATVVKQPVLAIECKASEKIIVGRDATFDITVKNTGDAPVLNAVVSAPMPAGATFVSATEGGTGSGNISWNLGTLAAGASKNLKVVLKPTGTSAVSVAATATGACAQQVATNCTTNVIGIPALLLDGTDDPDPIEVGSNVTYTLSVTNQSSTAPLTNVSLVCTLEEGTMQYVSQTGPTQGAVAGPTITFAPIATLAPKERRTYTIVVKAKAAGQVQLRAEAKSNEITRPLLKVETTNFFQ